MADGVTSSEMEIKLLNVARASIKELREDYTDYLGSQNFFVKMTTDQLWKRWHEIIGD